jgi:hypothetical protein
MKHYGVSADWLETFLQIALEQEQEHIDWVVANRESIDRSSEQRPDDDERMKRYRERKRRWTKEQRSAQAAAWLRALKGYEGKQAELRVMSQAFPGRFSISWA